MKIGRKSFGYDPFHMGFSMICLIEEEKKTKLSFFSNTSTCSSIKMREKKKKEGKIDKEKEHKKIKKK